jgi:CheY-like chemotaxis protein
MDGVKRIEASVRPSADSRAAWGVVCVCKPLHGKFPSGLAGMNSSGPLSVIIIDGQEHYLTTEATKKVKILVVEDENIVLKTMTIIFSKAGYETRGVTSAEAALALLEDGTWIPDLAIVDVNLPGMNGIDLAVSLGDRYPRTQVSLFSGRARTANLIEEARLKGHVFDDVIAKPVHPTVFLEMAESLESSVAV